MKKNFLLTIIFAVLTVLSVNAQNDKYNMTVTLGNGTTINVGADDVSNITFNDSSVVVSGKSIGDIFNYIDSVARICPDSCGQLKTELASLKDSIDSLQVLISNNTDSIKALSERLNAKDIEIELINKALSDLTARVDSLENSKGGEVVPEDKIKFVDLGLSVKWADRNVGADDATSVGNYYAWGEVEPKDEYSNDTYVHVDENGDPISIGTYDNTTFRYSIVGDTAYDVAARTYGAGYALPTKAQANELFEKCTITPDTVNNVAGYRATGPNGNSIFMPNSGFYSGTTINSNMKNRVYLWTGETDDDEDANGAYMIYISSNAGKGVSGSRVRCGLPIRAVSTK